LVAVSGSTLWSFKGQWWPQIDPVVHGDSLLFVNILADPDRKDFLNAVDVYTGKLVWSWTVTKNESWSTSITNMTLSSVDPNKALLTTTAFNTNTKEKKEILALIDLSSGITLWTQEYPNIFGGVGRGALALSGDRAFIFQTTMEKSVSILVRDISNGSPLSTFSVPTAASMNCHSDNDRNKLHYDQTDDVLVGGCLNKNFAVAFAVNATDGAPLWTYNFQRVGPSEFQSDWIAPHLYLTEAHPDLSSTTCATSYQNVSNILFCLRPAFQNSFVAHNLQSAVIVSDEHSPNNFSGLNLETSNPDKLPTFDLSSFDYDKDFHLSSFANEKGEFYLWSPLNRTIAMQNAKMRVQTTTVQIDASKYSRLLAAVEGRALKFVIMGRSSGDITAYSLI